MGFFITNDDQRVRISLSNMSFYTIKGDMEIFGIDKESALLNIIIENFNKQAETSMYEYLSKKRTELEHFFSRDASVTPDISAKAIETMMKYEQKSLLARTEKFRKTDRQNNYSKLYHLSKTNYEYLTRISNEDIYYTTAGKYLKALVEEYCSLSFIERERIIRKKVYDIVISACKNNIALTTTTMINGKETAINLFPYRIITDQLHSQEYLVCFSKIDGQDESTRRIASFSMARFPLPSESIRFSFSEEIKQLLDSKTSSSAVSFLLGEEETIRVRLTPKGKGYFKRRLYSRPQKDENESTDDIYVFHCSQFQIVSYFFSFESEAEILEPVKLREQFKKTYKKAYENYVD